MNWRPLRRENQKPWWDTELMRQVVCGGSAMIFVGRHLGVTYDPNAYANDRDHLKW